MDTGPGYHLRTGSEVPPTRRRILDAATRLFAEGGFDGVSMPEIAREAGITAGAIYKHFDSKAVLFLTVAGEALAATSVPTTATIDAESRDPVGALRRLLIGYGSASARQARLMAVETHRAAIRQREVSEILSRSIRADVAAISAAVTPTDQDQLGASDRAEAGMIFIMGLMHLDTLLPERVGDEAWAQRMARIISKVLTL